MNTAKTNLNDILTHNIMPKRNNLPTQGHEEINVNTEKLPPNYEQSVMSTPPINNQKRKKIGQV